MSGTDGRTYGGDCNLVHIQDGMRGEFGKALADLVDSGMRAMAGEDKSAGKKLCPGCYMIALYNAALYLAERNGQDKRELCRSMAEAFNALANDPNYYREEIHVIN